MSPGAFLSGLVFALGLGLAGMLDPGRVLAFLDLAGPRWDPSLMLVLGAAVGVYALGSPRFTADLPPPRRELNLPLILGAALFGVGWGLVGLCPGPALVDLTGGSGDLLLFVAAMLTGMALLGLRRLTPP
ncbi:MAG: YeeE/YedE family protein [Myxococcales bacterium]|nr:YeeE/YedE family protein [Myxococcales bacterium]